MAEIISIINMKGGVGKTTLTKELGYYMNKNKKKNVLLIDLDPQSNLTQSFFLKKGFKHSEDLNIPNKNYITVSQSIQNLFNTSSVGKLNDEDIFLKLEDNPKLDLIPGALSTIFLERASNTSIMEKAIFNLIESKGLDEVYDYVLIDCPPTYSVYTVCALLPSNFYLTPVDPGVYSVLGITMLDRVVKEIIEPNNLYFKDKPINSLGIIFTRFTSDSAPLATMIKAANALQNKYFFKNEFLFSKKFINKPKYFISDNDDTRLTDNLSAIFDELEERIHEFKQRD